MKDIDNTKMHEVRVDFHENSEGLIVEKSQTITDDFLKRLSDARFESTNKRAGEMHLAASVPTSVHELWLSRDNYDCTKEPIRKTIAKLKAEGLDAFIASNKQF